jgi:prepilin-type N-terminal cleavage/methylation domain-containing protein
MRTSVPGSKARLARGFTLLELMVVVAMIGVASAVVSFALPDPSSTRLEREAARLIALLELLLGPEPLLPRQGLRLRLGEQQLRIGSDGLKPFAIEP